MKGNKEGNQERKQASREELWKEIRNDEDGNERKKKELRTIKYKANQKLSACYVVKFIYPELMFVMWTINDKGFTYQDCDTCPWPHKVVFRRRSLFRHCHQKEKQRRDKRAEAAESWASSMSYYPFQKHESRHIALIVVVHYTSFPKERAKYCRVRRIASHWCVSFWIVFTSKSDLILLLNDFRQQWTFYGNLTPRLA